jgi:hypothetical protein
MMRCKIDGWLNNDNCTIACDCHLDPRNNGRQAGPLMVRHIIDGQEVLLPEDAQFDRDDLGGTY